MLNTAIFIGRLTADPELRHTSSDTAVTSFTVAVDRSYVKTGAERQADFIDDPYKREAMRTKTGTSARRLRLSRTRRILQALRGSRRAGISLSPATGFKRLRQTTTCLLTKQEKGSETA